MGSLQRLREWHETVNARKPPLNAASDASRECSAMRIRGQCLTFNNPTIICETVQVPVHEDCCTGRECSEPILHGGCSSGSLSQRGTGKAAEVFDKLISDARSTRNATDVVPVTEICV